MNPTSEAIWCNPPPPGTDNSEEIMTISSIQKDSSEKRIIDRIDPFLKSTEYIKYERKIKSEHSRRRSRSGSRHRSKKKRSRSRSKGRHRHRRRHYSSSRSRSRSRSRKRHENRRNRHSKSRSRSRSKSHSKKIHKRSRRSRSHSEMKNYKQVIEEKVVKVETDDVEDEEEVEDDANENAFKNDGSFMEMFKKMQEEKQKEKEAEKNAPKNPLPLFGKRRGGKVLKTGLVQKSKTSDQEEMGDAQDAWTLYMKEVKRYKEACCDDDSKTRLLVK